MQNDKKLHCIYSGGQYLRQKNVYKNHMKKDHFIKYDFSNMKSRNCNQISNEKAIVCEMNVTVFKLAIFSSNVKNFRRS